MRYIKKFENSYNIEIGEYVICDEESGNKNYTNFLKNNIGQVVSYYDNVKYPYVVKYENIPDNILNRFDEVDIPDQPGFLYKDRRVMGEEEIIFHSKDKKDLEMFLTANKYNL